MLPWLWRYDGVVVMLWSIVSDRMSSAVLVVTSNLSLAGAVCNLRLFLDSRVDWTLLLRFAIFSVCGAAAAGPLSQGMLVVSLGLTMTMQSSNFRLQNVHATRWYL